jgi:hypothetical protein
MPIYFRYNTVIAIVSRTNGITIAFKVLENLLRYKNDYDLYQGFKKIIDECRFAVGYDELKQNLKRLVFLNEIIYALFIYFVNL